VRQNEPSSRRSARGVRMEPERIDPGAPNAVDHEGEVLDMLVQRWRDERAALRLMRKLLRKQGFAPKQLTTDKLASYGAAFRHLRLTCRHERGLRFFLIVRHQRL
jgi:transposase-like protein